MSNSKISSGAFLRRDGPSANAAMTGRRDRRWVMRRRSHPTGFRNTIGAQEKRSSTGFHSSSPKSTASGSPGRNRRPGGSAIDGYATGFNNQQHVIYIDTDNHIHELMVDNAWHDNDLGPI
jgi:hypothetical protein